VRRALLRAALALPLCLGGCAGAAEVAGAVTGTASTFATANPAVGVGVGLGVRAATTAGLNYVFRRRHRYAQDEVAGVVGSLAPGETRPWRIEYTVPVGNAHGEVHLLRAIDTPLAACREALFSVVEGEAARQWFVVTACRGAEGWKWASAEPATGRWGSLH
jgi:hypothetical protein